MLLKNLVRNVMGHVNLLPKDDPEILPPLDYFESQLTVGRLKELLFEHVESDEEISYESLKPFLDFLNNRCENVQPLYKENTSANVLCKQLARQIVIAMNTIQYRERQGLEEFILMPNKIASFNERERECAMGLAVLGPKDSEQFIKNLMYLDPKDWKKYCELFTDKKLLELITNGKNNLNKLIDDHSLFAGKERYNKAILFCKFELLRQELEIPKPISITGVLYRAAGALYHSLGGTSFSKTQEKEAIEACQNFICSKKMLNEFATEVDRTDSNLHPHKDVFNEETIKKLIDQIGIAASKNPAAPKSQVMNQNNISESKIALRRK